MELASKGHNDVPSRADEPYRRAVHGIRGRIMATMAQLIGPNSVEGTWFKVHEPYKSPEDFTADLNVIDASLRVANDQLIADERLARNLAAAAR